MFKIGDIVTGQNWDWYGPEFRLGVVKDKPFHDNTGHTRVMVQWGNGLTVSWDTMNLILVEKTANDILKELVDK